MQGSRAGDISAAMRNEDNGEISKRIREKVKMEGERKTERRERGGRRGVGERDRQWRSQGGSQGAWAPPTYFEAPSGSFSKYKNFYYKITFKTHVVCVIKNSMQSAKDLRVDQHEAKYQPNITVCLGFEKATQSVQESDNKPAESECIHDMS